MRSLRGPYKRFFKGLSSNITGSHYTLYTATHVVDGTSSCYNTTKNIPRISIGIQATPHIKNTGNPYKDQGVRKKLVQTGKFMSDHAVKAKTAVVLKFCQTSDGNAQL